MTVGADVNVVRRLETRSGDLTLFFQSPHIHYRQRAFALQRDVGECAVGAVNEVVGYLAHWNFPDQFKGIHIDHRNVALGRRHGEAVTAIR